jgi:hypothetical protein
MLQALLVSLISQLYVEHWRWFGFSILQKPGMGLEVFAALAVLIGFINWCFRYNFAVDAKRCVTMKVKEIAGNSGRCIMEFMAGAVLYLAIWQLFSASGIHFPQTSAYEALAAAAGLLSGSEIWGDIRLSLLEIIGGISLGGSAALAVFALFSTSVFLRKLLSLLLALTYISAIVWWLWLVIFALWSEGLGPGRHGFLYVWHKVIAVGCLTFFPLFQALWGFREFPLVYRILSQCSLGKHGRQHRAWDS